MYTDFLAKARLIVAEHKAQYEGVYLMLGGGGGQTTTTQKADPWSGQQPYLLESMKQAQNLYDNQGDWPQYYQSSTVSPFNDMENNSLNNIYDLGNQGNSSINSANNALTNYNNGSMLMAGNPYFQNMAQSVASTLTPQLEAQFTQGNAMNNPAAAYAVSNGLSNAIGNLAYQNYNDQSGNQIKAAGLSPDNYQAQLSGQNAALTAGQTEQGQQQQQLNDLISRYTYNQQLPYQMLNQYANTVNGQYGGTNTLTQPYQTGGGASGTLSGALGGASAGSAFGPWGTAAGAVLGGLFGNK